MSTEPWELEENPSRLSDYNWYSDDVPARKFYLFIAEIGHRLRHLMTDPGPIKMIDLCEQCAEGQITEDELSDLADTYRPGDTDSEQLGSLEANNLYWWVADRYKVNSRSMDPAVEAFALLAAVEAGLLATGTYDDIQSIYDEFQSLREHPIYTTALEGTELEWGGLVRDIYGPNPFHPPVFAPSWRTDTVTSLARGMYESRDFSAMPILADALQDAGCDNEAILTHCRDEKAPHVRGCWVVDLVLDKS